MSDLIVENKENELGDSLIRSLIRNIGNDIFNWNQKKFIRKLKTKKYHALKPFEKAAIQKMITWLKHE